MFDSETTNPGDPLRVPWIGVSSIGIGCQFGAGREMCDKGGLISSKAWGVRKTWFTRLATHCPLFFNILLPVGMDFILNQPWDSSSPLERHTVRPASLHSVAAATMSAISSLVAHVPMWPVIL
jgi:hypothetical protein